MSPRSEKNIEVREILNDESLFHYTNVDNLTCSCGDCIVEDFCDELDDIEKFKSCKTVMKKYLEEHKIEGESTHYNERLELIPKAIENITTLEHTVIDIDVYNDLITVEKKDYSQYSATVKFFAVFSWCPLCDEAIGDEPFCSLHGDVSGCEEEYYKKGTTKGKPTYETKSIDSINIKNNGDGTYHVEVESIVKAIYKDSDIKKEFTQTIDIPRFMPYDETIELTTETQTFMEKKFTVNILGMLGNALKHDDDSFVNLTMDGKHNKEEVK